MKKASNTDNEVTAAQLDAALGGDRAAMQRLFLKVARIIHAPVAKACGAARRGELEDVVQEVLFLLLKDDARRLRAWDPARGPAYLRTVAWRGAIWVLRNGAKYPSARVKVPTGDFEDEPHRGDDPETVVSRHRLEAAVLAALEDELSDRDFKVLCLLMEGCTPEEVRLRIPGLQTNNTIHVIRHRIVERADEIRERLRRERRGR